MNTDIINTEFAKMIAVRGVHKKLKTTSENIRSLRFKLTNGLGISMDLKQRMLQAYGWRQDDKVYNQGDLVAAVKFALRQGVSAKEKGAEYLVEKFLNKKV